MLSLPDECLPKILRYQMAYDPLVARSHPLSLDMSEGYERLVGGQLHAAPTRVELCRQHDKPLASLTAVSMGSKAHCRRPECLTVFHHVAWASLTPIDECFRTCQLVVGLRCYANSPLGISAERATNIDHLLFHHDCKK